MSFVREEGLEYEKASRDYLEIKRRKSELSEKDKKLFKKLESVEIGHYGISLSTMLMITDVYQNNAANAFNTIFRLGFLKGERKCRNQVLKK